MPIAAETLSNDPLQPIDKAPRLNSALGRVLPICGGNPAQWPATKGPRTDLQGAGSAGLRPARLRVPWPSLEAQVSRTGDPGRAGAAAFARSRPGIASAATTARPTPTAEIANAMRVAGFRGQRADDHVPGDDARGDLTADRAADRPHDRVHARRHAGLASASTASTIRFAIAANAKPIPSPMKGACRRRSAGWVSCQSASSGKLEAGEDGADQQRQLRARSARPSSPRPARRTSITSGRRQHEEARLGDRGAEAEAGARSGPGRTAGSG